MTSAPPVALGERDPAAEAERRGRARPRDGDAQIAARDVDLQHAVLEVALLAERGEDAAVFRGDVLGQRQAAAGHHGQDQDQQGSVRSPSAHDSSRIRRMSRCRLSIYVLFSIGLFAAPSPRGAGAAEPDADVASTVTMVLASARHPEMAWPERAVSSPPSRSSTTRSRTVSSGSTRRSPRRASRTWCEGWPWPTSTGSGAPTTMRTGCCSNGSPCARGRRSHPRSGRCSISPFPRTWPGSAPRSVAGAWTPLPSGGVTRWRLERSTRRRSCATCAQPATSHASSAAAAPLLALRAGQDHARALQETGGRGAAAGARAREGPRRSSRESPGRLAGACARGCAPLGDLARRGGPRAAATLYQARWSKR